MWKWQNELTWHEPASEHCEHNNAQNEAKAHAQTLTEVS